MADYFPDIVLQWNENTEQDISHYRVWVVTTPGSTNRRIVETTKELSVTVKNVKNGTYYFTVTAVDETGNESPYSDELAVVQSEASFTAPSKPINFGVKDAFIFKDDGGFEFKDDGGFEFG